MSMCVYNLFSMIIHCVPLPIFSRVTVIKAVKEAFPCEIMFP